MLKILSESGRRDEGGGSIALAHFAGIGAVRLLAADAGAHLLEYVEGPCLSEFYRGTYARESDVAATAVICDLLSQIHGRCSAIPSGLRPLSAQFQSLFVHSTRSPSNRVLALGAQVARHLLDTEEAPCVLHGDIHHGNILLSARGWIAIDPKGLKGERTYDVANVFYNPESSFSPLEDPQRIEDCTETFALHLGLERRRVLEFAFAYGCLSATWFIEDDHSPERTLRIARQLARLLNLAL